MEQAGGKAETGTGRILEVMPEEIHQRVPCLIGSKDEVEMCVSYRDKH
jgi:fructose-1,6-bisphosphatase I